MSLVFVFLVPLMRFLCVVYEPFETKDRLSFEVFRKVKERQSETIRKS